MTTGLFDMEKFRKSTRENIKIARETQRNSIKHSRAKLKIEDLINIRHAYDNHKMTNKELSEKYNVNVSTIRRITNRKTWTRLP